MAQITLDEAIERITSAVEYRGEDFVYPDDWMDDSVSCEYFAVRAGEINYDEPRCIVGLAFADLLTDTLSEDENRSQVTNLTVIDFTDDALDFVDSMQTMQDNQAKWGQALESALSFIKP